MPDHVIIDGNNLFHAMHAHAPVPAVGRETLFKIVERWALLGDDEVTLVFDGPTPRAGLAGQMASKRIDVRFSAAVTADDVIVEMIHRAKHPELLRIVSGDTAIIKEARYRRCKNTDSISFIAELFPSENQPRTQPEPAGEKPDGITPQEREEWFDAFGGADLSVDPLDDPSAMEKG